MFCCVLLFNGLDYSCFIFCSFEYFDFGWLSGGVYYKSNFNIFVCEGSFGCV